MRSNKVAQNRVSTYLGLSGQDELSCTGGYCGISQQRNGNLKILGKMGIRLTRTGKDISYKRVAKLRRKTIEDKAVFGVGTAQNESERAVARLLAVMRSLGRPGSVGS